MTITFQPVAMALANEPDGRLAYADERLVAVLVRLSGLHDGAEGRWFLEAGFGVLEGPAHPTFATLDDAASWIKATLARRTRRQAT